MKERTGDSLHGLKAVRGVAVGLAAALSVALSLLLILKFGILGAGIASGVSLLLLRASLVVVLYQRVGVVSLPFRFRGETL